MAKIQGFLGVRDKQHSILKISLNPDAWAVVERFRQSNGSYTYLMTEIPRKLLGHQAKIKAYLKKNRKTHGEYCTHAQWAQGSKSDKSAPEPRTAKHLHEWTSEIAGDIHRKSSKRLSRIIKASHGADIEFLTSLLPN